MAAPKQVRRAARAAERHHREAYTPEPEEGGEVVELAPEPEPEPEEVPEPQNVAEPVPEPEPEAEAAPEPEPEPEEDWEQRYKVLQGKYNAEVPRYARELREVREQLEARTQILARLDEARQAPEPAQPSTGGVSITAEERADYGEDFLDVVARQAQLAMAPQLEQLQQTLARMDQGVGNVTRRVQQSDQERVLAYLDSHVPEWQKLNDDDQFLTWLEQRDRFTGRQRRELLTEAYNAFDASRVAAFFTSYQDENAAVAPAPSNPPSPPRSGKVPMTQLVAPGTPREAGSASAQDGKRTWTQADIAAFYGEVQRGRYRDAAADKLAIEKDIVAAAAEGRIIG